MKKYMVIVFIITIFVSMINFTSPIYAAKNENSNTQSSSLLDIIFGKGGKWFSDGMNNEAPIATDANSNDMANKLKGAIMAGGIIDLVKTVGYLIFFIAGAALGIKYMISGYEGKAFVKDGLISYSLGIIFFFFADQLFSLGFKIFSGVSWANSYSSMAGYIWATFKSVISVAMVVIIVIYGLKYMWAPSQDKANMKKGMVPIVIGAILILCTAQIIGFVINTTTDILGNENSPSFGVTNTNTTEINSDW